MNIERRERRLIFILEPLSTISNVEVDKAKVMASILDIEAIDGIEVDGSGIEEMDTAYLQLVLSISATARELGIQFLMTDRSERVKEIIRLYGLDESILRN